MKTPKSLIRWAPFLAGVLLLPGLCFSSPALPVTIPRGDTYHPDAPPSALSFLPFILLPGRFLFTGGYVVHLNGTEMQIDHIAKDSHCTPRNRIFMISAGFAQPVGQFFSSRFELPIFSADRFSFNRLAPASVGDYVLHLSGTPLYTPVTSLLISARF